MQVSAQELELTHKVHHCIQQQQWHQAKHYCQQLLKADPADAQVHHLLGLVHVQIASICNDAELRREHQERAISAFEAASRTHPEMLEARINLGHAYLQSERIAEALTAYQAALRLAPDSDLIHISLAEAYRRRQDIDQALVSYGHAVRLAPHKTEHLIKTGNYLRELKRHEDASACYEQAIQIEPENADAYAQMAISMGELGYGDAALGCCKIALEINPQLSVAHYHLALLEMRRDHEEAALRHLDSALDLDPRLAAAWMSKGVILIKRQDYAGAKSHLDRSIELGMSGPEVFQYRAVCRKELGLLDKAIDDLETALDLDPTHGISLMTLGTISHDMKRYEAALHLYTQAIQYCPDRVEAYSNLGAVLFDLNRFEDARQTLEAALDIDPQQAHAWSNLGANLKMLHRYEKALQAYDRAIELDPQRVDAFCHKGLVLQDMKRMDEALACYEQALSIDPGNTFAHWNKAFGQLLMGNFEQGWGQYEARWQHKKLDLTLRNFRQPRWTGNESLSGKKILVYCEQGLGDTLQFARFIPDLIAQGAEVIFEVHPPLVSLISRCLPGIRVLAAGQPIPDFDTHSPLLSLPNVLKCVGEQHFFKQPVFKASFQKIEEWRQRLQHSSRPRVGLVWSGNAAHQNDRNRSISLQSILNAMPDGFDYVCLQNEIRPDDLKAMTQAPWIHNFSKDIRDFEDTAALCHLMQVVITVDTSVAHLSASLGKQTWTLIPYSPDWRWMLNREDTPWYPSMRLYRQQTPGSWEQELLKIASNLALEISNTID